jgi:predicted Rossmann fold nucleotide-binding protein DprA/Smf involved in DNA uptake
MGLIVGVSGGRDFTDRKLFYAVMDTINRKQGIDKVVSGGARGADELAYRYAIDRGITFICQPPKPEDGFPRAFFRRNLRIVAMSDLLVAFPTKNSRGTWHAITMAERLKKKVLNATMKESK